MKISWKLAFFIVLACSTLAFAETKEEQILAEVNWQHGPATGGLGDQAEIKIPLGFVYAGKADTLKLMEATQNPISGSELGFVAPENLSWFVVFEFSDVGYIKDDEKDKLDPDAILESIKKGTEESNKERREKGWTEMKIIGWEQKPRYDANTNNLEWAVRGETEGNTIINYNTRLLGRRGVMSVMLVVAPEMLTLTLPTFKELLAGFSYKSGNRYAEFTQGDKIAKYGLTGLVVGGAAAVAAKAGLFKWLWKVLVGGAVVVGAFFKKLFGRKKA